MNSHYETLEFPVILATIEPSLPYPIPREIYWAISNRCSTIRLAVQRMAETTAARKVLDAFGAPPLPMMTKLNESLTHAEIGTMLSPEQLTGVSRLFAAYPASAWSAT